MHVFEFVIKAPSFQAYTHTNEMTKKTASIRKSLTQSFIHLVQIMATKSQLTHTNDRNQ